MIWYIIKRVLLLIPIMMCVVLIVYALLYTTIGANKRALSSQNGDWLDGVFEKLNIEETFISRYIRYCYNVIVKLNFGSTKQMSAARMTETLLFRLKITLRLTLWGFLATLVLGIPIGMFSALHHGQWQDNVVMGAITFLSSIPTFTLALGLVLFFTLRLRLLPAYGFYTPLAMIMPTITLAVGGIASTARFTRTSALEVMEQQYVTALRSKGLKENRIIYRHVLRNALVPIVSNLNQVASAMLCGAMVVERFFSLPGLGFYLLGAVSSRDQLGVMGCSIIIAFMLSVVNILTDVIYVGINPQIRAQYTKGRSAA